MRHDRLLLVLWVMLSLAGSAFAGSTSAQVALNGFGNSRAEIGTYSHEFSGAQDQPFTASLMCDHYWDRVTGCENWNTSVNHPAPNNLAQFLYGKVDTTWNDYQGGGMMLLTTSQSGLPTSGDAFFQAAGSPVATITLSNDGVINDCKVPEPASLLLVGTGLVAMAGVLRRKLLA